MSHRTERNKSRKERGLSMLTESKVPTVHITLLLSFVLSDQQLKIREFKPKTVNRLILITGFCSCNKDDESKILEETEVSYEIFQQGEFSSSQDDGIDPQYLVFKTENEWSEFYNRKIAIRNEKQAQRFSELNFDFDKNTLVIVTSGYDENCCKLIVINKVYQDHGRIYVTFDIGESDNSLDILSQSYILLEVTKNQS